MTTGVGDAGVGGATAGAATAAVTGAATVAWLAGASAPAHAHVAGEAVVVSVTSSPADGWWAAGEVVVVAQPVRRSVPERTAVPIVCVTLMMSKVSTLAVVATGWNVYAAHRLRCCTVHCFAGSLTRPGLLRSSRR